MQLSVTCPRCESKYQLAPEMRGKRMRCPSPICRAVFEVRDDNDPPVEAAPPPPPVVAKPVDAKPPEAPPVVATPAVAPKPEPAKRKPIPRPIEPALALDFPDDFPGDDEAAPAPTAPAIATEAWQPETWDAPAVRATAPDVDPGPIARESRTPTEAAAPRKRRWALWAMAAMFVVLATVGGVSYWRVRGTIETNEADNFQRAQKLYENREFAEASSAFQKLHRDFPESSHSQKYRFLGELSDVRGAAYAPRETPEEAVQVLERVLQLAGVYRDDSLLKARAADLWQTLHDLANELTALAEREKSPALVPLARRAWTEAKKYPAPTAANQADRERTLQEEWTRIEQGLAALREQQHVVATLKKLRESATALGVQEALALVEKTKKRDDAEIRGLLNDLFDAHRNTIQFVAAGPATTPAAFDEDAWPSLSVTPRLKFERAVASTQPLVLALARGVLYALEPAQGDLRWTHRLGIDTHLLPLRVPADTITPELVLAVSSDQRSLSAFIAETGEILWRAPLSDVCLGQPVLVDRQVLVPTLAGRIDEIEIAEGRLLGSYHVGQALTLGGVRQPGTSLVYFPADEFGLYVIDVTKRTCANILYTRHVAGSLRGLPSFASTAKGPLMLWCQAKELDRATIKPYSLPIQQPEQKPIGPIVELSAISAAPWTGANRLAVATDKGFLSLWGFQQKGTRDPLLFPLLKQEFLMDESKRPGRCQVVHAGPENYWTLTRGRLQRLQSTFDPSKGPGLLAPWTQPIALGTLLHAVQTRQEPDGRTILYLTTQADEHPTCLCSAIDAESGKILWQRQLGILPQQAPVQVGTQLFLRDGHGVLRFDPSKIGATSEKRWQPAGAWLFQEDWTDAVRIFLTRESSYVQLALPRDGKNLHMRVGSIVAGDDKAVKHTVKLPAPLQGTPALGKDFLLLPLADGIIRRINLKDPAPSIDREWRAVGAEADTRGHLVFLNATDFVLTDGARGLARITSTDGKTWDKRAEKELPHRITTPPTFVPATEKDKARLCVADASDTLTLLEADGLKKVRAWAMPGKITAGPFLRDGKIGCVVGRNRLVWLHPNQDVALWEYTFAADIVGEPHLIDGVLVVGDVAGQLVALDPSSGRARLPSRTIPGPVDWFRGRRGNRIWQTSSRRPSRGARGGGPLGNGLTLKANVAPTAAPLPFGADRAFVPLTDGTIMLVPLAKLR